MHKLRTAVIVCAAATAGYVAGVYGARDQRQELLQLDREFDEAVAREGLDGWVKYFAADGMMFPNGGKIATGEQAIREAMKPLFDDPKFVMRWEPLGAEVSGNLGYTYGLYRASRSGRNGEPVQGYGKYVTMWRKQRGGVWKIALDIGNASPTPEKK